MRKNNDYQDNVITIVNCVHMTEKFGLKNLKTHL